MVTKDSLVESLEEIDQLIQNDALGGTPESRVTQYLNTKMEKMLGQQETTPAISVPGTDSSTVDFAQQMLKDLD